MHELGVVFYVIKDVKEVALQNNINKVNSVTLDIGEVSGVIHEQLIDCWDWAKKREPVLEEAVLKINTIKAVTFCEDCKKEYETVAHGKICPYCGSENTYLLEGNEFSIKEIEVPDEDN
ncbi:MAG: hydrogenase maturation nickel metallochaperone HypA [Lachnospiraceae bacterium]|nr:hydrogenase maturation nickel metallochaperone HypA [Lachnospiraceae bacterium]